MDKDWHVTFNLDEAMSEYIGEIVIEPKLLTNSMRVLFNRSQLQPAQMYYYGTPDKDLKEMFGYE